MDSGMRSNPFSKDSHHTVPLLRKREMRPMDNGPRPTEHNLHTPMGGVSGHNTEQSDLFHDRAQVEQWMATSTTNSMYPGDSCIPLPFGDNSNMFEYPHVDPSILQGLEGYSADLSSGVPYAPEAYNPCSGANPLATAGPPTLMTESSFESSTISSNESGYELPNAVDMIYTTSANSNLMMGDVCASDDAMKSLSPIQQAAFAYPHGVSELNMWSSPSCTSLEPSLSSSYSQGNLFHCVENSPATFSLEDTSSDASIKDETFLPPSLVDFHVQAPFSYGPNDDTQFDMARLVADCPSSPMTSNAPVHSTIRASNCFARSPLSENTFWPSYQPMDMMYDGIPLDVYMSRRPSGEHDNSSARRNELYQIGPKEDGLYHCPFETTEGCKHKPEKLKCNYDKHLDSHLKPYRCKVPACGSVPFSSTACLLRHEREAHGMHGHGDRPYMCTYPDCDRSHQGNGFPRRWNLMDHMKRVHDHHSGSANGRSSPALSDNGRNARRRRTSTSSQPSNARVSKSGARTSTTLKHKVSQKQRSTC